jgi:m7GpppX diphosphatase
LLFISSVSSKNYRRKIPKVSKWFTDADLRVIGETQQIYKDVTLPYIESKRHGKQLQWVYDILDKKKQSENILLDDPDPSSGFILLPHKKWDQSILTNLYCLAIVNRRDPFSLRCLTERHLPLLTNILDKVCLPCNQSIGLFGC